MLVHEIEEFLLIADGEPDCGIRRAVVYPNLITTADHSAGINYSRQ